MKKAAVIGFGIVGNGVCELLQRHRREIEAKAGEPVVLSYICDLRDFPSSPYGGMHAQEFDVICRDPEVAVVAELTGARRAAYEMTKKALACGKSVVTSNKEVVAEYGAELLQIAKDNGVSYLFEAAVGGAIPILRPIRDCLETDRITRICGILNGTTNYILTEMSKDGASYESALEQAKALGYAEPNPDADVLGFDACRKISILCACMTGELIPPSLIPTSGITGITPDDLYLASYLGGRIKLIGSAEKTKSGARASVRACFVSGENPLSFVSGVNNGILVRCEASGDLMFYGRGAGSIPTAAAVAADIAEAVKEPGKSGVWRVGTCDAEGDEPFGEFIVCKGKVSCTSAGCYYDEARNMTAVLLPDMSKENRDCIKSAITNAGGVIASSYCVIK